MAQQELKPQSRRVRASTFYPDPFKTGTGESYAVILEEGLGLPEVKDWVEQNLYKTKPGYKEGSYSTVLPTVDWKELYNQEQWPSLYGQNMDDGRYVKLNYSPSDYDRIQTYIDEGMPGVNRYDFMQYQRQHPITQIPINIQPVERPPILPIDAVLAGYTPISQLPKVPKSGNEQQYERASGHIKQLRRPK